jgi:hypothetical protein
MNCCVLRRRRSATPFGTCWEPPNLILEVKDNGSGISNASLQKSEGFGLRNMRTRASQIDGKLDIHTVAGHGTSIVLTGPIPSWNRLLMRHWDWFLKITVVLDAKQGHPISVVHSPLAQGGIVRDPEQRPTDSCLVLIARGVENHDTGR